MKLTLGKRIVILIHALVSLLMCVALALKLIVPGVVSGILSNIRGSMGSIGFLVLCIALLMIYAALSVALIMTALNRGQKRADRGFINVDSGDSGRVRIAISAVEQMVRQSVRGIDGISDLKIDIEGKDDAIAIAVNVVVASGSHVPTLTRNMQRSIRQFVEVNCGVAVNTVSISIDAVTAQPEGLRQRIWGKGKADKVVTPEPMQSIPEPDVEEPIQDEPSVETVIEDESSAPEAEAYDFDKPYESEFAKDLEAMRAREAAEASANDDIEEDSESAE